MDHKENEVTPPENNIPERPRNDPQPDRSVPYAFNADREDIAKTNTSEVTPTPGTAVKKKKGLIITLILAALVMLGLGLAYVYWYQNPNKVVSDAVVNALAADSLTYTGTVTTAGETKMVVTLNGGAAMEGGSVNAKFAFDVDGKKYTLDGNGIIDEKSDLYVKVQNIDGLVNNYRRAMPAESHGLFDKIIDKIDDKWIKISSEDVKSYSAELANIQKCTAELAKKMQTDKKIESELMDLYKKHPFVTIDKNLGAKNGSLGYVLSFNQDIAKEFAKEYKKSSLYDFMVKCDDSFAIKDDDVLEQYKDEVSTKANVELWVDRWTHQITKLSIKDESESGTTNIAFEPKFNRPVSIVTPSDSITIEQLQNDIQSLLQSTQSSPAAAPATES